MKRFILLLSVVTLFSCSSNKNGFNQEIKAIPQINRMPDTFELSGDSIYWNLVKGKQSIVPFLINKIDDTSATKAPIGYVGRNYTVGEVAIEALYEIIRDLPDRISLIKNWERYEEDEAFNNYWYYMNESEQNRLLFKKQIEKWYNKNKQSLIWVSDNKEYRKSEMDTVLYYHPSRGYYKLKSN
jgi:hypothetical protein